MNRLSLATHVVQKLNVPSLLAQCGDFVQRNYELIYDKHNWKDVELVYTDVILANTQTVDLNSSAGRVASVRANGKVLDPINAVQGMQFDATIFERTGQPEVYEEIFNPSSGNNQIKVYPQPTTDCPLLVVAIRKISQLSANESVPQIRNIDNVILAYTEADLLERVKQYGMAAQKRTEADAKLADAIALDTESRSNFPREITSMTVDGGTLAELGDAVCARLKTYAPEARSMATEILRRNYLEIYDMMPWRECRMLRLVSATGGSIVTLPKEFDSVLDVRQEDALSQMFPADMNFFFNTDPTFFDTDNVGTPTHYVTLPNVATPVQPQGEFVSFVSDSPNDKSIIFVRGELNGVEQFETLLLNGTTPVTTTLTYDTLLVVGKEITTGKITIQGASTNTLLDVYLSDTRARSHVRFMLFRNAGQDLNLLVHGKRKVIPLRHLHDKPMIRGAGQALVYMTVAELAPLLGADTAPLAATYGPKAEAAVKKLVDRELKGSASKTRIVPLVTDFNGRVR